MDFIPSDVILTPPCDPSSLTCAPLFPFPAWVQGLLCHCRSCCCPAPPGACSAGPILTAAGQEPCSTCTKIPQVTQNTIFNVVSCWSSSEPSFKGDSPQCLWTEWAVGMSLELEFAQFAFQQYCHLSKGMISIQRWKSWFFGFFWLPPLGLILTYLNSYNLLFLPLFLKKIICSLQH